MNFDWFRNLFLSHAERELIETIEAYKRVREAFLTSKLSALGKENWTKYAVSEALERAGHDYYKGALFEALMETAEILLDDGGRSVLKFNDMDLSLANEWSLELGVELRKYLRTKEKHLADPQGALENALEVVIRSFEIILKSLPDEVFSDLEELEEQKGFSVSLIDLINNPAEVIEGVGSIACSSESRNFDLFLQLVENLEINHALASGVEPRDRYTTKKGIIFPTQIKNKSPSELVDLYLGNTPFQKLFNFKIPFKIPLSTRFEHCHIVGGSGHGKTQLLQNLIYQDLLKALEGKGGLCVIDSQGDLINTISHLKIFSPQASENLAEKLIIVDPNDIEYPVCLNMFDLNLERIRGYKLVDREKILNGTIALYEYIFGALLGAELTQKQGVIFKYLAQLMMVIPKANIHTLRELMEDAEPFRPYIYKLEGTARKFFEVQFFSSTFNDTKKQILNRLWGVLSNRTFEMMFTQERNKIDLFEAMNSGKIVLINTAKDLLKKDGCQILGRFFIAMIAQSALERSTIPADRRRSFFVYIDEAHDYFDENIEDLLNQARKFKVGMVLSHQNLEQLSLKLKATILASTSVKIAGGVSFKDAGTFAKEMNCSPEFIQSAKKQKLQTEFACWVRNLTDRALKISVPLGAIEKLPKMEEAEYQSLIDKNRSLYSGTMKIEDQKKPFEEKGIDGFDLGDPEDLL